MKLVAAARQFGRAQVLLLEIAHKGGKGGILGTIDEPYRDQLIGTLDAHEREAFQQAYARLADQKLHEERQIEETEPEQTAGEETLLSGVTHSQPAPDRSELQSAHAREQEDVDRIRESIRKRLQLLRNYREEGLITEDEYSAKKAAILDDF